MPRKSPSSMSVALPDGQVLDMALDPSPTDEPVSITVVEEIRPRFFEMCPICGDPATDDEHVPPASIGGKVMTRTCGACNNRLGSQVEADLTDWSDNAVTLPQFSSTNVRGPRRSSRILWRTTRAGEFVLIVDGRSHPEIIDMLQSGEVDLTGLLPDRNRYCLALLKHAYLASCMKFGVPQGEVADQVRRDLIAARDAGGRHNVPTSALALGLTVLRRYDSTPVVTAPVVRAIANEATGPCDGVLLAGRIFVSWSSTPASNAAAPPRHLRAHLHVGGQISGIVSSVSTT